MATTIISGVAAAGKSRQDVVKRNFQQKHLFAASSFNRTNSNLLSPIVEEKVETHTHKIVQRRKGKENSKTGALFANVAFADSTILSIDEKSFNNANLSSSTIYSSPDTSIVEEKLSPLDFISPSALGTLQLKESPLKCLKKNLTKSVNNFTLRSRTPHYTQHRTVKAPKNNYKRDSNLCIDYSAVEAISEAVNMNLTNGGAHENRSAFGFGANGRQRTATDINRNNGSTRNGRFLFYNMQKSKIEKETHTQDKELNLPRATSPGKTKNPTNPTDVVTNEDINSDSIPQSSKIKAGSRFISAIRKISGSSKASKESKTKTEKKDTNEQIVVSKEDEQLAPKDAELTTTKDANKKKKLKFSKLVGRNKSKCKNSVEESKNLNVVKSKSTEISKTSETISEYEHSIKTPEQVEILKTPTTTRLAKPLDRIQKVQITISGKKIEHTKIEHEQRSITTTTTKITEGTRSEQEYLLQNPSAISDKTQLENPIVKENEDTFKRFETKKPTAATETKAVKQTATAQEQIVLKSTTSAAKEIHLPTKLTSERLVIVTESTCDTPPSEKAPTKPSRDSEQKIAKSSGFAAHRALPAIVKGFKSAGEEQRSAEAFNIKGIEKSANLMQNPLETTQRGHRLPKPTNTTNINTLPTTINLTTNEAHLDSHATQLAATEQDSSREQEQCSQATSSTTESRSLTLQAEDSVNIETANSQDEVITSGKSDNLKSDQTTVNFAVGSIVHLPPKLVSLEVEPERDLEQQLDSVGSNISSDSHDSSRKRQRYIAKPTLTQEEFNSGEEVTFLKTLTRRDYTLDSDTEDNIENQQMPAFGDLTMDQEMEPAIMASGPTEKREHLYKILVIGELGTGKTSFIKRYVHQFFSQNYRATIGVDFALKVLHWDNNTIVRLQLWDIAGQERFGNMTRVYYKEAVGAFIVFDVTRSGTFDCVSKWKEDLDSKVQLPDGSPIPCILLANKCDQEKQGTVASPEKMEEYVREKGFAGWFETSAKENINIEESARALVNKILLNDKLISTADLADNERFNLNNTSDQTTTEPKSKCSC